MNFFAMMNGGLYSVGPRMWRGRWVEMCAISGARHAESHLAIVIGR